jgi:hypothetical protein
MKKLFLSLAVALGISAASFAQTAAPVAVKTAPPVAAKQAAPKKNKATPAAKPAPASPAITKVKADGTPDMRYKENKQAKTAAPGPKKADGTPDYPNATLLNSVTLRSASIDFKYSATDLPLSFTKGCASKYFL